MENLEEALKCISCVKSILGKTEYSKALMYAYNLAHNAEKEITEYVSKNKIKEIAAD